MHVREAELYGHRIRSEVARRAASEDPSEDLRRVRAPNTMRPPFAYGFSSPSIRNHVGGRSLSGLFSTTSRNTAPTQTWVDRTPSRVLPSRLSPRVPSILRVNTLLPSSSAMRLPAATMICFSCASAVSIASRG